MKAKWLILAVVAVGFVLTASAGIAAPPDILITQGNFLTAALATGINGELGLYLIGTWEVVARGANIDPASSSTVIQLVNPTPKDLWAFVTYWNQAEEGIQCIPVFVSSNGMQEHIQTGTITFNLLDYDIGAVKVLVTNTNGRPDYGLVGSRQLLRRDASANILTSSEIRLQSVPTRVLFADPPPTDAIPDELKKIICLCQPSTTVVSCS